MDGALKFWRYSIFTRMIVTFLLIMAPIYMIALVIYNWGISNVRQELESSMRLQTGFYLNNLETEIQRINLLLFNTLYDDSFTDLANLPLSISDYEKSKLINVLQRRLLVLQNSNLYLKNVTAYIPSVGIDVSSNEGMLAFSQQPYEYLNKAKAVSSAQLLFYNNSFVLRALLPLDEKYRLSKSIQMLSVTLSKEQIISTLKQLDTRADSGAILFSPEQHFTLFSQTDSVLEQQIEQEVNLRMKRGTSGTTNLKLENKNIFVLYLKSDYLNIVMVKYVPMDYFTEAADKFRRIFWLFSLVSVVIIVIFSLSTFKFVQKPLLRLVRSLRQVEKGNLEVSIIHQRKDEFGYLYLRFNAMVSNLNQLIEQVYKQQILTQHAELKQLQSQINPHFLYNTYFVLYNMVMTEDYELVKQFTHKLGSYFQYITRNAAEDVPLLTEVQHAQIYCDIQSLRFFNRLHIEFEELPEEYKNLMVPRLILQPIIENAFEHGLEDKQGMGLLEVQFAGDERGLTVIIKDNGKGASAEEISMLNEKLMRNDSQDEVTAILNIHRRLILKFGGNSGLSISAGESDGLKISLRIEQKGE
jgi:two-component system sensor histidine kinase YesM